VFDIERRPGERDGGLLSMDFPARPPDPCAIPPKLVEALGRAPQVTLASRDLMAVFATEDEVRSLAPRMAVLAEVDTFAVIVTAPGKEVDFVSVRPARASTRTP
jgi:hypothetical protein